MRSKESNYTAHVGGSWNPAVTLAHEFGFRWEWCIELNEAECTEMADALERALPTIPESEVERPRTPAHYFAGKRELIVLLIEYLRGCDGLDIIARNDPRWRPPPFTAGRFGEWVFPKPESEEQ